MASIVGESLVMRPSVIVVAILLTGCATNPREICASLVAPSWIYQPKAPAQAHELESFLPSAPSLTNEGTPISGIDRLWFRRDDGLLACTLSRAAKDTCSVQTTEFDRHDTVWVRVSENSTLCQVLL